MHDLILLKDDLVSNIQLIHHHANEYIAIEPLLEKEQLVILETPFWQLARPLYMLVHRQKYQGPGLKAFMKYCDE